MFQHVDRRVTPNGAPMDELLELRDLALRIALDVAPIPADAQPRVPQARTMGTATKSSELDLVTELDRATERAIVNFLAVERPQDGMLGEEGASTPSSSGYTWVIDPIDGTVNYFYGHPTWAISLGVLDAAGEPVVGVVHAPQLDETFVASKGGGAFLISAGEWIRLQTPPAEDDLALALLGTGFPYDRERRSAMASVFASFAPRVRDLRRIGSAAIDICYVAAGRMHGYYERDTQPWDRAAAFAVAREVGLQTIVLGQPDHRTVGRNLSIVALPALARTLTEELAALGVTD